MDVTALLAWLTRPHDPIPTGWGLGALAIGAVIAALPVTWRATRLAATYVHEVGHALVAVATGRRVTGMRIHADTSGSTDHVGVLGLGTLLIAFAGYPAPALAGLALVWAEQSGHARWAIAVTAAVALLFLLVQRSWRGLALTVGTLASMWALAAVPQAVAGVILLLGAGYLLMASPRTILELRRVRRQARQLDVTSHSDADALARMTGIPALLWEVAFLAACVAAAAAAVQYLLR